jgi:PKD repeat protein
MSRNFTSFEEQLKQTVEGFELPYEEQSWNNLEKVLDSQSTGGNNSWLVALVAAATLILGGGLTVYNYAFSSVSASGASKVARFENISQVASQTHISAISHEDGQDDFTAAQSLNIDNLVASKSKSKTSGEHRNQTDLSSSNITSSTEVLNSAIATEKESLIIKAENSSISVQISARSTCAGGEIEFTALNGPREGSYLWNFGDNSFDQRPSPKHKYSKPGVYSVSLSITNKRDGVMTTSVMKDLITVHQAPTADFEWNFINGAMEEPTVKIINTSENANHYNWVFSDGTTSNDISPIRSYTEKGKQTILLEVSNAFGCVDKKVKYISFSEDFNLKAPAKFNPNKEVFMPETLKQGKSNFKLTIYNGQQPIYETTSKSKGWDGKLPNGSLAAAGQEFPWIVIMYNETTKEEKYFSGIVTILP